MSKERTLRDSTWKSKAGRNSGSQEYQFGDVTMSVFRMLGSKLIHSPSRTISDKLPCIVPSTNPATGIRLEIASDQSIENQHFNSKISKMFRFPSDTKHDELEIKRRVTTNRLLSQRMNWKEISSVRPKGKSDYNFGDFTRSFLRKYGSPVQSEGHDASGIQPVMSIEIISSIAPTLSLSKYNTQQSSRPHTHQIRPEWALYTAIKSILMDPSLAEGAARVDFMRRFSHTGDDPGTVRLWIRKMHTYICEQRGEELIQLYRKATIDQISHNDGIEHRRTQINSPKLSGIESETASSRQSRVDGSWAAPLQNITGSRPGTMDSVTTLKPSWEDIQEKPNISPEIQLIVSSVIFHAIEEATFMPIQYMVLSRLPASLDKVTSHR